MRIAMWPDAGQLLLLRAAIGEGDAALAAFALWCASVPYQQALDGGSYRLLPLVYANQKRPGGRGATLDRLAGVYRRSWCEAQLHLRRAAEACALLQARGVPVLVNKGLAAAFHYYDSPALRPMSDMDLLIPRGHVDAAIACLHEAGWQDAPEMAARWANRTRDMMVMTSGLALRDDAGNEIDLHWRMIQECANRRLEARFWREAQPLALGGCDVLRPDATTMLFHTVVHGVKPNVLPPIRWVADAAMILRREGDAIDWDWLVRLARLARLEHRLGLGLEYLRGTMGLAIPAEAAALAARPPRLTERIERRTFGAMLAGVPARRQARLDFIGTVARLVGGDGRVRLPWLALRWAARRLLPRARPA